MKNYKELFKRLNASHSTIKFTTDYTYDIIHFLDVQVSKKDSTLETDLYCKNTDRHQDLNAKSCHGYLYKKYIPLGQGMRLRRIISDDNVLDECLKEL